jgi:hypothetical protein
MKNDYLWDKTGNDAEIERMENALLAFRCPQNDAPKIPNNVLSFKKAPPRKFFPVFRALAASFVLAFVLIGVWFYFDSKPETAQHKIFENPAQKDVSEKQNKIEFPTTEQVSTDEKFEKRIEKSEPKTNKQNYKIQKLIYKPKPKKAEKNQILKLTAEEKAAYEKLMLALSITGSKLKIVKDTVQNLNEQTAINTENNIDTRKK